MTPFLGTLAFAIAALADAIAGEMDAATLDLYQNNLVFDPDTVVLGDLTVADYSGYAQVDLTWAAPSVSDDGNVETQSNQATFRPTGTVITNQIYGYYVKNAGGDLIGGGTFEGGPLPMESALDVIKLTVVARPSLMGGYGSVIS